MWFEFGGYLRLNFIRIYRAPILVHWSVLVACIAILATSYSEPIFAVLFAASYFGVILLHEFGHAFLVTRFGYHVRSVKVTILHGACEYETPWNEREDVVIAWGGVLAQLAVAIPLICIAALFGMRDLGYLRPVIVFLGFYSVIVAIINLAPSPSLDGYKAWKLIPMLVNDFGAKVKAKKRKIKMKIVK